MNHNKALTDSQLESLYKDADVMEEIRAQFGEDELPTITSEDAFSRETLGSRSKARAKDGGAGGYYSRVRPAVNSHSRRNFYPSRFKDAGRKG